MIKIPFHQPIDFGMKPYPILSNGDNVHLLEKAIKELYDIEHVIACSSASIGLLITLQALFPEQNWEWTIYTPAFAWFSSKWAIESTGNKPMFLDIDPDTWLMKGGDLLSVSMPVHTFGSIIECDHQFRVYDGAHALGSKIEDFGSATIFSLAPTKLITSCEGGLILTNDSKLASRIIELRDKVSRMSELNARWGLESLSHLPEIIHWKRKCYYYYKKHLPGQFQEIPIDSNFNTIGFLTDWKMPPNIEFKKYYFPLEQGFENTNKVYGKIVCLPSYLGCPMEKIVNDIKNFNEVIRDE